MAKSLKNKPKGDGVRYVICHSGAVFKFKFKFFIDSKHLRQINHLTPSPLKGVGKVTERIILEVLTTGKSSFLEKFFAFGDQGGYFREG